MGMMKEFKDFAMKGNLVDIAVGFVMGASFSAVTKAFIDGIIMPPINLITNGGLEGGWVLREAVMEAGEVASEAIVIDYGTFISALLNFIIVAFVMFMLVKGVNNMKKKEEEAPAAPPEPSNEEKLLTEIRDALKK